MSGQGDKGRLLIFPHEAAVAVDVGAEDSGELAFQYSLPHAGYYVLVGIIVNPAALAEYRQVVSGLMPLGSLHEAGTLRRADC